MKYLCCLRRFFFSFFFSYAKRDDKVHYSHSFSWLLKIYNNRADLDLEKLLQITIDIFRNVSLTNFVWQSRILLKSPYWLWSQNRINKVIQNTTILGLIFTPWGSMAWKSTDIDRFRCLPPEPWFFELLMPHAEWYKALSPLLKRHCENDASETLVAVNMLLTI